MELTAQELNVIDKLADAYVAFVQLDRYHPQEDQEFVDAIHRAQTLIMSRLAVRQHPKVFYFGPGHE